MSRWSLTEAKRRFEEVVRAAEAEGPQEITLQGRREAVVLSRASYERLMGRRDTLVEFMRASPLVGVTLDLTREGRRREP